MINWSKRIWFDLILDLRYDDMFPFSLRLQFEWILLTRPSCLLLWYSLKLLVLLQNAYLIFNLMQFALQVWRCQNLCQHLVTRLYKQFPWGRPGPQGSIAELWCEQAFTAPGAWWRLLYYQTTVWIHDSGDPIEKPKTTRVCLANMFSLDLRKLCWLS